MTYIKQLKELNELMECFFIKGTLTNCFFLADAFYKYMENNTLSYVFCGKNLVLLLDKTDFCQLYFYLNDLSTGVDLSIDKPVVMEILYRGEKNKPLDLIKYWSEQGFNHHLLRDNMVASFDSLSLPPVSTSNLVLDYVSSSEEALFTEKLLSNSLDFYTGDLLSIDEIYHFVTNRNISIAMYNNEMAGVLQFEIRNKIVWLSHIAVVEKYRGKGIANELIRKYILDNNTESNTKYQLWVIRDNIPAVKLYRKFGFINGNKSTLAMLKNRS